MRLLLIGVFRRVRLWRLMSPLNPTLDGVLHEMKDVEIPEDNSLDTQNPGKPDGIVPKDDLWSERPFNDQVEETV